MQIVSGDACPDAARGEPKGIVKWVNSLRNRLQIQIRAVIEKGLFRKAQGIQLVLAGRTTQDPVVLQSAPYEKR